MEAGALTIKSATAKANVDVVPPPGEGLLTAMLKVAPGVMSLTGITAVSDVVLRNVVARGAPPACTTELELKFAPVTFSVTAELPGATLVGEILDIAGPDYSR